METNFDRRKSLQELEGDDWGDPDRGETELIQNCLRLRRKPLKDFTVGDLCELITQNIGLHFLVPLAIERLEENPLVEGDYYPGDLLVSVLRVEEPFWLERPDLRQAVEEIVKQALPRLTHLNDIDRRPLEQTLKTLKKWTGGVS